MTRDDFKKRTAAGGTEAQKMLARELAASPRNIRVYGIEGSNFSMGEGLTPEVEAAA